MRQSATNIRLEVDNAVITIGSGFSVAILSNGSMRIENPTGVALRYRPSRLENTSKGADPFIAPEGERMESEQIIKVDGNTTLELRTSTANGYLKAELLFRTIADGESVFSGIFAEWISGDWVIGFRRMEDFLTLIDKVFAL